MWNDVHMLKIEFKVCCWFFSCVIVFIETVLAFNYISCLIFSIIHKKWRSLIVGKIIEYRTTNLELFRDHTAESLNFSYKD